MRWEGGKGGRLVRWESGEGGRVIRWEGSELARWKRWKNSEAGGRYLILFKSGGHKITPRSHLFVSDVNQGNKGFGWVQDFYMWWQGWKDSP